MSLQTARACKAKETLTVNVMRIGMTVPAMLVVKSDFVSSAVLLVKK